MVVLMHMAKVSFDEENPYRAESIPSRESFLIRMVLLSGIARTVQQAQKILLGFAILGLLATVFLFASAFHHTKPGKILPVPGSTAETAPHR